MKKKPATKKSRSQKKTPPRPVRPKRGAGNAAYKSQRERNAARQATIAKAGREIGEIPKCKDLALRAACEKSLAVMCQTCAPQTFFRPFSRDQLEVSGICDQVISTGGIFAFAMPRGSGKSTICHWATVKALITGARQFVIFLGATDADAKLRLESLQTEFEQNETLLDLWPEVVYPLRCLDGIYQRRLLHQGTRVRIDVTGDRLSLPTIPGSRASFATVLCTGIMGSFRGKSIRHPDGRMMRPDLFIADDIQTDQSADRESEIERRLDVISKSVLSLGAPGRPIAGFVPTTVLKPGDAADQLLNRDRYPDFQGRRYKLLYAFPDNEKLWDRYAELRHEGLKLGSGIALATEFYRLHRAEMDAGAQSADPNRFDPPEISAIQHAMNWKIRDESAFWSEAQNSPLVPEVEQTVGLDAAELVRRTNGFPRGIVPDSASRLTVFVDVQQALLYWAAVAFDDDFTGYVVDYGTTPGQDQEAFTLRSAKRTIGDVFGDPWEAAIRSALADLGESVLGRQWRRVNGSSIFVSRAHVDINWERSAEAVAEFCKASPWRGILRASQGLPLGPGRKPMSQWNRKPGERVGLNWREVPHRSIARCKVVQFDANWWKSFSAGRLSIPRGDRQAITLFGTSQRAHEMFCAHLSSETVDRQESRANKRVVDVWDLPPNKPDNHWWDCFVGCVVAAAVDGADVVPNKAGAEPDDQKKTAEAKPTRRRIRFSA